FVEGAVSKVGWPVIDHELGLRFSHMTLYEDGRCGGDARRLLFQSDRGACLVDRNLDFSLAAKSRRRSNCDCKLLDIGKHIGIEPERAALVGNACAAQSAIRGQDLDARIGLCMAGKGSDPARSEKAPAFVARN